MIVRKTTLIPVVEPMNIQGQDLEKNWKTLSRMSKSLITLMMRKENPLSRNLKKVIYQNKANFTRLFTNKGVTLHPVWLRNLQWKWSRNNRELSRLWAFLLQLHQKEKWIHNPTIFPSIQYQLIPMLNTIRDISLQKMPDPINLTMLMYQHFSQFNSDKVWISL